ncbi:MAG: hypothetical protein EXR36_05605 [Betaproteobacteria bacterium]|nr:hypothetical protein [Betaproteobacteria bacterium]
MTHSVSAKRVGSIATGRSGDKGDVLDLTIVAYNEKDYALLSRFLSVERVTDALARVAPSPVERHELPKLRALKFVAPRALPGGVQASLHAGLHWQKAAAALLLELPLPMEEQE